MADRRMVERGTHQCTQCPVPYRGLCCQIQGLTLPLLVTTERQLAPSANEGLKSVAPNICSSLREKGNLSENVRRQWWEKIPIPDYSSPDFSLFNKMVICWESKQMLCFVNLVDSQSFMANFNIESWSLNIITINLYFSERPITVKNILFMAFSHSWFINSLHFLLLYLFKLIKKISLIQYIF